MQGQPRGPPLHVLTSSAQMRAAAILGPGCSPKNLQPFQTEKSVEWSIGLAGSHAEADVILLFGGDGTVHRHLGQLVRPGRPVLIVPAGSGNDFARALGFRRMSDALAAWKKFRSGSGNTHKTDLGLVARLENAGRSSAPRYFGSVASVGLDAEVARRANKIPRWLRGSGGYALTLIPTIFQFAPFRMKIFTAGEAVLDGHQANPARLASPAGWSLRNDQPMLLAAFANAPLYGGGMKIAPQAKMDDGLLDICIVGAVDPFKLFCLFPTVYSGGHLRMREVEYSQVAQVRIETEHPLDIYADGEFVCQTPAEIGVERGALTLITP
jgi:diacylglycerol kinase (ATP)